MFTSTAARALNPPASHAGAAVSARSENSGHVVQLDGLRALAVLAVLLHHSVPLTTKLSFGTFGVRLFFVLSGFLITGILLRARDAAEVTPHGRRHALLNFYARRVLRIFPLYYGVLLGIYLLELPGVRASIGWHLAYLSNFYNVAQADWPEPPISHLWSLSVEEQFYLLWPTLVLFAPRRWLLPIFAASLVVGPLSRAALVAGPTPVTSADALTPACLDGLGAGALLALLQHRGRTLALARVAEQGSGTVVPSTLRAVPATGPDPFSATRLCRASLGLGLLLLALLLTLRFMGAAWRLRMVLDTSAYVLLAVWLVERASRGFAGLGKVLLEWRPLVYVGTISYGVYVYHEVVPPLLKHLEVRLGVDLAFPAEGPRRFLYLAAVTLVLAAASWHWFEKPLNDLKRFFPYERNHKPRGFSPDDRLAPGSRPSPSASDVAG